MKLVYQTKGLNDNHEEGSGNCLGACLATLMNIDLEETPQTLGEDWILHISKWAEEKGYNVLVSYNHIPGPGAYIGIYRTTTPVIRQNGEKVQGAHAVVMYDGVIAHDPASKLYPESLSYLDFNLPAMYMYLVKRGN